jgi:hypothetical protein
MSATNRPLSVLSRAANAGFFAPFGPAVATSQEIRTALRTSGRRFFYEGEGIQRRDGAPCPSSD